MSQSHVVSGLLSKRSELLSMLEHYTVEVDRLDAELKHIDATIKLFAPDIDLRSLPPKRFVEANKVFKQGESGRLVLEVLREAGGTLNTQAIAQRIADKKSLDASKVKSIRDTILDTLKRLETKGVVIQSGKDGLAILWMIA